MGATVFVCCWGLGRRQVLTIAKVDFLWLLEGTAVRDRLMCLAEVCVRGYLRVGMCVRLCG